MSPDYPDSEKRVYLAETVDPYIEDLHRQIDDLNVELARLATGQQPVDDQVEAEALLGRALITAQRVAEEELELARGQAREIVERAEATAARVVEDAHRMAKGVEDQTRRRSEACEAFAVDVERIVGDAQRMVDALRAVGEELSAAPSAHGTREGDSLAKEAPSTPRQPDAPPDISEAVPRSFQDGDSSRRAHFGSRADPYADRAGDRMSSLVDGSYLDLLRADAGRSDFHAEFGPDEPVDDLRVVLDALPPPDPATQFRGDDDDAIGRQRFGRRR